jgi:hypothetical protein|tara:strand:+ start:4644 stop:5075 length:432 start_codon:yes stop_codon:yes gene_type:complete
MSEPTVNLITSPDKLLNSNLSFLLLNPSVTVKEQFNDMLKELSDAPINLYLSENEDDIAWVLDVAQSVNYIIIDIDNTKESQWVIGHLLSFDKTYYLTNQAEMQYNILNINRVYDIRQIAEGENYFVKVQQRQTEDGSKSRSA